MRRNLALAALLCAFLFTPAVRAEDPAPDDGSKADDAPAERVITPIDRKEMRAIDKAFGDYFSDGRPKERLEEVDRLIRELDEDRAEDGLSPILADVDSLVAWIREEYEYDRLRRGVQFEEWTKDENDFGADFNFYVSVGSKYKSKEPMATILLIPDSGIDTDDLKDTLKAITKQKLLKERFLILCPALPEMTAPVKLPETPDKEEQARRDAKYAAEVAALEERKFQSTMAPLNWLMRNANVDPDRLFVVGLGDGASRAIRVGTSWTDLLAGVLVQNAEIDGPLRENVAAILAATIDGKDDEELGEKIAELLGGDPAPTRNVFRKEIAWRFEQMDQQRAFWAQILVERPDEKAPVGRLDAKIEGNTITIDTERVEEMRIFLNDHLVNLDEPVTVVVNGEKQEPVQLTRSFRHLIEWIDDHTGDRGYAFTASMNVRVPSEIKPTEGEGKDAGKEGDADGEKEPEKGEGAEK